MPSAASRTGIGVKWDSISDIWLLKSDGRWTTTTNAASGAGEQAEKNSLRASRPPAEAPIPTMGKFLDDLLGRRDKSILEYRIIRIPAGRRSSHPESSSLL